MGTPASKPVSLARHFSVLKLIFSLYTKKDHVLLALAWPTRHKYCATTYVDDLAMSYMPLGAAPPDCPYMSLATTVAGQWLPSPFRTVSVQSQYQTVPPCLVTGLCMSVMVSVDCNSHVGGS